MSKFQGGPLDVADRIVGYLNEMRPRETDDLPGAGDTDSAVNRLCEWREDVFLVLPEDDRYWRQLSDLLR